MTKTEGRKSHDTVPLNHIMYADIFFRYSLCYNSLEMENSCIKSVWSIDNTAPCLRIFAFIFKEFTKD
jgi:hypothetical protein